jgi:PTH1 family peptidyl-tRNA hydrolase
MSNIFDIFKKLENEKKNAEILPVTHIIVGLGNKGKEYENTRHNIGFCAIDYIAGRCGAVINRAKFDALVTDTTVAGKRVLLVKPQTYMNLSGKAVAAAAAFYKVKPENIIVLSDDVNLDVGRVRVSKNGSDGGQKGLRSIIKTVGSSEFPRIRIGVGKKPHPDYDLADWVLGNFSANDKATISELYPVIFEGVEKILCGDVDGAMQICNSKASK